MAFTPKTWEGRSVQYPGQIKLIPTGEPGVYRMERYEGEVYKDGDLVSDAALNDLERRIAEGMPNVSHRNLLHNWDFRNPVNQRGQSTYNPVYNYSIDRWVSNDASITVNSASITLTRTGSTNHFFLQRIENSSSLLAQKTLTFSIEIDGVIYSGTGVFPNIGASVDVYGGSNVVLKFSNVSATDSGVVIFIPIQGDSVTITRTKLELGSVSTLANDPPADYGEQLNLCKRFYQKSAGTWTIPASTLMMVPVETMRTTPAVTITQTSGGNVTADYESAGSFRVTNGASVPHDFRWVAIADL